MSPMYLRWNKGEDMSWIRGMLSGLLSAIESMVDAIHEEDQANTVLYMKQSKTIMDHIDAQWALMVEALEAVDEWACTDIVSEKGTLGYFEEDVMPMVENALNGAKEAYDESEG